MNEILEPLMWNEVPEYVFIRMVSYVSAGFLSVASDEMQERISLDKKCIRDPFTTFFFKVIGDSMDRAYMPDGAILVVDRSLTAKNKSIIVAVVDDEITVKRLSILQAKTLLLPESSNPKYKPLEITPLMRFEVWGVVTHIVTEAKHV